MIFDSWNMSKYCTWWSTWKTKWFFMAVFYGVDWPLIHIYFIGEKWLDGALDQINQNFVLQWNFDGPNHAILSELWNYSSNNRNSGGLFMFNQGVLITWCSTVSDWYSSFSRWLILKHFLSMSKLLRIVI